ncbi:MAG: hypothetical protein QGG26_16580 [Candidatus Undinarchaeales archaeon]|nr:hypothetical protein [Candidatus Undinarchaeales archaeon]
MQDQGTVWTISSNDRTSLYTRSEVSTGVDHCVGGRCLRAA